jgi:Flp pilus assembly pilin Flp
VLKLYVYIQTLLADLSDDHRGQATAEYALVLLGVAAIAMVVGLWAAKSGLLGKLFDLVGNKLLQRVG